MYIENILEKGLPILIIILLVSVAVGYAQQADYHCPVHGPLSARDEVISFVITGDSATVCGKCAIEFIKDSLPEIYKVEELELE